MRKPSIDYSRIVFKIQLPVASNYLHPQAYIYNKDRSLEGYLPVNEDLMRLFPEGKAKIYVIGSFNPETGEVDTNPNAVLSEREEPSW